MQKDNNFLGTAPIGQLMFRLALPTITAQLINMLYNIVDRIYIGHMPEVGDLALTGVGVCMPLILIVSAFASLVSAGGAPRASRIPPALPIPPVSCRCPAAPDPELHTDSSCCSP